MLSGHFSKSSSTRVLNLTSAPARVCFVGFYAAMLCGAMGILFLSSVLLAQGVERAAVKTASGTKPADAPERWKPLIGSYVRADKVKFEVLENDGALQLKEGTKAALALQEDTDGRFHVKGEGEPAVPLSFLRDATNSVTEMMLGDGHLRRRGYDADISKSFHVASVRPLDEIRKEALLAPPPHEAKVFRKADLVELAALDPAIHLDVRYATTNNFLGTAVYTQARGFLQRPAAAALIRALHTLAPMGYGLLIHDGYRP